MIKKFLALTPVGKYVVLALAFVVALLLAHSSMILKSKWDIWRAGIHPAQKAEQQATGALQEGKGALDQASQETHRVLEDYARAQQAITNLSQQIMQERQTANQLRAQIAAAQAQRNTQPRPTTLKGVQDDLAQYAPVYRAGR